MRNANAKIKEPNMSRVSMQNSCKILIWKPLKCKHAMIGNKYEITTGLPIGKGSKF